MQIKLTDFSEGMAPTISGDKIPDVVEWNRAKMATSSIDNLSIQIERPVGMSGGIKIDEEGVTPTYLGSPIENCTSFNHRVKGNTEYINISVVLLHPAPSGPTLFDPAPTWDTIATPTTTAVADQLPGISSDAFVEKIKMKTSKFDFI